MDENEVLSPEEQKLEQEALADAKEDEVRAKVLEEYGFDEVDDSDKIEKAVADRMASRKALSQAIGQKIKHREAAAIAKKEAEELKSKATKAQEPKLSDDEFDKKLDAKLNERLEERDLGSMSYSDEVKAEIRKVAKAQGVSISQAVKDPYIQFKIEAAKKDAEAEEGAVGRKHKSGGKQTFDINSPPELDPLDPESLKKYDEWFDEAKKKGY